MNREELAETALDLSKGDTVRLQLEAITERYQAGVPIVEDDISEPYEAAVLSNIMGREEQDNYSNGEWWRVNTTSSIHSVSFKAHPNHDTERSYSLDIKKHRDSHIEPTTVLKQYRKHSNEKYSVARIQGFEVLDSDTTARP